MKKFSNDADTWVEVAGEGSLLFVHYYSPDNTTDSTFTVHNEKGDVEEYHKDYMMWHVPSEHTLNNRQYAAELQVYFVQYATNRKVALSFFFDKDL
jgi:carbonic anhydrase